MQYNTDQFLLPLKSGEYLVFTPIMTTENSLCIAHKRIHHSPHYTDIKQKILQSPDTIMYFQYLGQRKKISNLK